MKQEYLMLAHTYNPVKQLVAGWFISEKLDGMRAFWDGGLSRGMPATDVPYANTVKDYRLKDTEIATGLWSRTGKVIHAPSWWLNELPNILLDGELWIGRGRFQELTSIVSKHKPGEDWNKVRYLAIDSPRLCEVFKDREIKVRDYVFEIKGAINFYHHPIRVASSNWTFEMVYGWLTRKLEENNVVKLVRQERLPFSYLGSVERINKKLETILTLGGEGVMLRKPESFYRTQRCRTLLKHKPYLDDEAVITGFTTGKETNKGSRLLGMIGALVVDYKGKRLELSGLTDDERQFKQLWMKTWAEDNPGKDTDNFEGAHFMIGQTITFKYRELSDDGVPKEARYFRSK